MLFKYIRAVHPEIICRIQTFCECAYKQNIHYNWHVHTMPYRNASAESWNFTVKIKHRNSKETANINYDMIIWSRESHYWPISLTHRQSLYSSSFSSDFFILLKSLFLNDNTAHKQWRELGFEKSK